MLDKAELIVNTTVYHSRREGTHGIVHPYGEVLNSIESSYINPSFSVTEEWKNIPCGHIKDVGVIVIRNDAGQNLATIPTDAEREEIKLRTIELSLSKARPHATNEVRPGCSVPVCPVESDPEHFRVRCRRGTASCWIMVIPR